MSTAVPRDPYEVLGVARDADDAMIKKAFRRRARELHPDVNPGPEAEAQFKEAAGAYEILNDPERRAAYDRHGHAGLRGAGGAPNFEGFGSISDLFDAFFGGGGSPFGGGGRSGPRQGGDVAIREEITLEQAAEGASLTLDFEAVDVCGQCRGNGAQPGTPIETCARCGGAGALQAVSRTPFGQVMRTVECDTCHGDGKVAREPCLRCDGRGREVGHRHLEVDVPAGIDDGQRIRLSGRGHAGDAGGPAGDLYVVVAVTPHERLVRDGDDLFTVLSIPAPRAALGGRVSLAGLRGDVDVEVAPGTQSGEILTIRGEGMPLLRSNPARPRFGDLRVVVDAVIPRRLTGEQKRMLEAFEQTLGDDNLRSSDSLGAKLKRLLQR